MEKQRQLTLKSGDRTRMQDYGELPSCAQDKGRDTSDGVEVGRGRLGGMRGDGVGSASVAGPTRRFFAGAGQYCGEAHVIRVWKKKC